MLGVPPVVSTVTASLNVSVTSTVAPTVQVPSEPDSLSAGAPVMVGASTCREAAAPLIRMRSVWMGPPTGVVSLP